MNTHSASETIYTVVLPAFAGPLELLLRLIERAELDITTIALAQVADQYLAHVRALRDPDPGALSAFLLIAAKLLVIKSRALLPQPPTAPDQPDDAADLVRQLQEYQRFRQAAGVLRAREHQGLRSFGRTAAPPTPVVRSDAPLDLTVAEMLVAVQRRMQLLLTLEPEATALPVTRIITVPEMADRIRARISSEQTLVFDSLFAGARSRVELLVALWALLELLKRRVIVAEQGALFGTITISAGPQFAATALYALDISEDQ